VDAALIRALELRRDVHRTHIGFMGCHAAMNALRIARALVAADPSQVVLMVGVELSSIHLIDGTRRDQLVAACLFGDGAAAAVIAADPRAPVRILGTASMVFPDTTGAMGWSIGDHGFEMMLAEDVPAHIGRNIASWLDGWLAHHHGGLGATRAAAAWCVHPGGPRVLEAVGDALTLPDGALDHSRAVLRECGNMSSVTTMFILDRIRASHRDATEARRVVALGFGPGLAGEAALVELRESATSIASRSRQNQ
jgi:predicted naringenin-chalcone synthase